MSLFRRNGVESELVLVVMGLGLETGVTAFFRQFCCEGVDIFSGEILITNLFILIEAQVMNLLA